VGIELADIFRQCGPAYRQKYAGHLPIQHLQVMQAIETCRTEALGGQVYVCPDCEQVQYSYHSCRNRHCPKCQNENAQVWLEQQQAMLLSVPYFLLTFTLPAGLREFARHQPQRIYDLLFRMSAEATQKLAQDPRFVGGQMGMVGVLHTWGRNLAYHPHVHYLVPAGGLASDGKTWLAARQKFLLPVKALSRLFRAKMRQALTKVDVEGRIPPEVWRQNWVVHCKAVGCGQLALKYLAPYIFRVAISNRRILKLDDDAGLVPTVTFRYRATDTGQERLCTLAAEEFIRRFLQHILPKGFVKVRYYGFFSSGSRRRLAAIRQQLGQESVPVEDVQSDQIEKTATALETVHRCPVCGRPMQPGDPIPPARGRSPP
jgi:cytochrome c-type biogenesis protein CcmH/NrfF